MRTEHGAAAAPLRGADGALAGTTGALLAPRLLAAAADVAAGKGVAGAGTPRRTLSAHNLVHDGHVRLDAEHGSGKLGVAGLLTACVLDLDSRHGCRNSL